MNRDRAFEALRRAGEYLEGLDGIYSDYVAAVESLRQVPEGYVLVPREPTQAMQDAGVDAAVHKAKGAPWFPFAWRAAIAASEKANTATPTSERDDALEIAEEDAELGIATAQAGAELPELPEPVDYVDVWVDGDLVERRPNEPHYTADQMRAYAELARRVGS